MSNTSLLGSYGGLGNAGLQFRNKLINGNFDIWQRGDNTAGSGYFADRWLIIQGVTTAEENASGSPAGFRRNALISRNVSGTILVGQRIEARNCYDLVGQPVTVTFYHVSNTGQTDSIKVGLKYANTEDTFSATTLIQEVTLSSSATGWKTVTFNALPSQAVNGLQLEFTYAVTGSSSVRLTGVQLEAGPVATPFEHRPIGMELSLCQRYYETGYSNVAINTSGAASVYVNDVIGFMTLKRAGSNVTITDYAGNVNRYSYRSSAVDTITNDINTVILTEASLTHMRFRYLWQPSGALLANLTTLWYADAEL